MTNPDQQIERWLKLPDMSQILLTRHSQGNLELLERLGVGQQRPMVWDSFCYVKIPGQDWQNLCQGQDWIVVTSAKSAQFFFESIELSWIKEIQIACVGTVTAECVESFGAKVALIAKVQSSIGLSQEDVFQKSNSLNILYLQPEDGRQEFIKALQTKHKIQKVIHYRKEFFPLPQDILTKLMQKQITTVLFYSPRVVEVFHEALHDVPDLFESLDYAVIGETTRSAVERYGGKVVFSPGQI